MYELPKDNMTDTERTILRKLRVWIVALGVACLAGGIGIGAMLAGHPAVAQNEAQIARAPEALSASFVEIARHVEPAVVNIDTKTAAPEVADKDDEEKEDQSTNPLLDMFRKQVRRPSRGVGSGFIVDPKGYILTNEHVVEGATRIIVRLQSGEEFRGRVVGVDEETDVAVVKVDAPRDLPTVKLGDSNGAQVGDWVLAIGSPFGLDQTVTAGIISTKERSDPYHFTSFQQFLQTDAAINRGNSGGPLVNMRGEVIGINSQIATSTGDYNGIGFALPANEADFVYRQITSAGKVRRGYLGITLDSVKSEYARVYGLPEAKGAIVTNVQDAQGPAGKAGIQANDIITEFNGQPVANAQDLINKVAATPVGQNVNVTLLRDAGGKLEKRSVSVTLGERPNTAVSLRNTDTEAAPTPKTNREATGNSLRLGLTLSELTPQIASERSMTGVHGLLVKEVDPNGIAADARPFPVSEGDIITRINRTPVTALADFQRVVSALKPGDAIVLNVAYYDRKNERIIQRLVQFTYQ
ncbi:MAG TPA: Do family serine endopeptidase [Pyrinomonadaceae bacterium]|jgi:serine protease Do|nr:Do family serine endopeptidase [Pyrinomonadaceae bacterium]